MKSKSLMIINPQNYNTSYLLLSRVLSNVLMINKHHQSQNQQGESNKTHLLLLNILSQMSCPSYFSLSSYLWSDSIITHYQSLNCALQAVMCLLEGSSSIVFHMNSRTIKMFAVFLLTIPSAVLTYCFVP